MPGPVERERFLGLELMPGALAGAAALVDRDRASSRGADSAHASPRARAERGLRAERGARLQTSLASLR